MSKLLDIKDIEKIAKALGDPYRLKIMETIANGKDWTQCSAIQEKFDLAQSTISHHIKQLVDAGLLVTEKDGRNCRYEVNREAFAAYINYLTPFKS